MNIGKWLRNQAIGDSERFAHEADESYRPDVTAFAKLDPSGFAKEHLEEYLGHKLTPDEERRFKQSRYGG